jgi:hypothetical protein
LSGETQSDIAGNSSLERGIRAFGNSRQTIVHARLREHIKNKMKSRWVYQWLYTLLVAAAVAGCAPLRQYAWQKQGVDRDESMTALAECRYQVRLNKLAPTEQNAAVNDCMLSKGFRWRQVV